jgi:4-amino-4-deoxy-L-arabinose transferase-like glycosyltransferase
MGCKIALSGSGVADGGEARGRLSSAVMSGSEKVWGAEARLRREAGETGDEGGGGSSYVLLAVILGLVCLLVRAQGLMALPIFGDEAIYLRWAQLIREGHPWVSLADPKPPLHFWLIAGVFGWAKDPLAAARAISVAAGVISVPAVMGVCVELGHLLRKSWGHEGASGKAAGAMAAILLIFCPFASFYQRLATADALFVAEMLLAVWAGLAWARKGWAGERGAWAAAIGLGVVMGAAMMTRQGLSYTLWAVPAAAVIAAARGGLSKAGRRVARVIGQLVLAGVIAGAMWAPYLTANPESAVRDAQAEAPAGKTVRAVDIVRTRVLYQEKFSDVTDRGAVVRRNAARTFLPRWTDARGREDAGWLWMYLTWPVYLAGVAGLLWLCVRGQWWVAAVLALWLAVILGPVVLLGNTVYSRYVLAGAIVLVVLAGWMAAELLSLVFLLPGRSGAAAAWTVTAGTLVGLLWLPMREIGRQTNDWRRQTLGLQDRYQYLTGWTAGKATMGAVRFIAQMARDLSDKPRPGMEGGLVVITDTAWGLPADAVWVYLSRQPGVRVYWTSRSGEPVLVPVDESNGPDRRTFWLRPEKWLFLPQEPVAIPANALVLYVTNDPIHAGDGDHRAAGYLKKLNPNLRLMETFNGIAGAVSDDPGAPGADDQVQVFQVQ